MFYKNTFLNNSTNISLSGATIYMQQITGLELDMKIDHWACFMFVLSYKNVS